jgi:hypothetical protein
VERDHVPPLDAPAEDEVVSEHSTERVRRGEEEIACQTLPPDSPERERSDTLQPHQSVAEAHTTRMSEILEDRGQALDLAAFDYEMGHPRRTIALGSAGILAPSFEVEDVQPLPAPGRIEREM